MCSFPGIKEILKDINSVCTALQIVFKINRVDAKTMLSLSFVRDVN